MSKPLVILLGITFSILALTLAYWALVQMQDQKNIQSLFENDKSEDSSKSNYDPVNEGQNETDTKQTNDYLQDKTNDNTSNSEPLTMQITSDAFNNNESIPSKYTCDGSNMNPPLSLDGIQPEAKSVALIVDDPDAPAGTWTHWLVWNIDPVTAEIVEGAFPKNAVQGVNDFGKVEYGGPCPPSGEHRYYFKAYSLGKMLDLPSGSSKDDLLSAMENHILQTSELIGLYSR